MQIGSATSAHAALFASQRASSTAKGKSAAFGATSAQPAPSATMSGSLSGLLAYMTGHAVRQGQAEPDDQADARDQSLTEREQDFLHRIATDDRFAEEQARILGTSYDWEDIPEGTWELDPAKTLGNTDHPTVKVQGERQDYYERMLADGVPPAQIYANLLAFNANLDEAYGNALDHTGTKPAGAYNAANRARLAELQSAMGAMGANAAGVHSWTRDLNDSDRAMLESMTGYQVAEDGAFVDQDGNRTAVSPSHAAVIAAISLARASQAQGVENLPLGDTITAGQYSDICDRVQVAMFQSGQLFDQSVRADGLTYLKNAHDMAATA